MNPEKIESIVSFEQSDKKQDRHTGKGPDATKEDKRTAKRLKSEHINKQEEQFSKEQIVTALKHWKNESQPEVNTEGSDNDKDHEKNWKRILQNLKDTSWEDASGKYGIEDAITSEDYIDWQNAMRKQAEETLKNNKKEAWEEMKKRNMSRTGDPYGDKDHTSLVH